jgi:hypothetical protein
MACIGFGENRAAPTQSNTENQHIKKSDGIWMASLKKPEKS